MEVLRVRIVGGPKDGVALNWVGPLKSTISFAEPGGRVFEYAMEATKAGVVARYLSGPPGHEPPPLQLDLMTPLGPAPARRLPLDERFRRFHAVNPSVYRNLVTLARRALAAGRERIGIKQLWEVLRWEYSLAVNSADEFTLNNDFTSRYARLIMDSEPDLAQMFETRKLRAA
jgi:hypothetical protein